VEQDGNYKRRRADEPVLHTVRHRPPQVVEEVDGDGKDQETVDANLDPADRPRADREVLELALLEAHALTQPAPEPASLSKNNRIRSTAFSRFARELA
jgi:hypothetical protein